jgi:hypothetical protein
MLPPGPGVVGVPADVVGVLPPPLLRVEVGDAVPVVLGPAAFVGVVGAVDEALDEADDDARVVDEDVCVPVADAELVVPAAAVVLGAEVVPPVLVVVAAAVEEAVVVAPPVAVGFADAPTVGTAGAVVEVALDVLDADPVVVGVAGLVVPVGAAVVGVGAAAGWPTSSGAANRSPTGVLPWNSCTVST